jgi:thiol-disulfide isomerase/thioredoxin
MDFDLVSVDGKPIKLADYHGKVCIADIWGTWCPPCREEIPAFVALQNKLGADGFQMLGFNHEGGEPEEDAETVRTFMAANEMNYPCSLINDEFLAQVPDFGGFPTTIFIDRHGKVRLKAVGFHNYYFLESVVDVLLAEEGPATATPEASTSTESD